MTTKMSINIKRWPGRLPVRANVFNGLGKAEAEMDAISLAALLSTSGKRTTVAEAELLLQSGIDGIEAEGTKHNAKEEGWENLSF